LSGPWLGDARRPGSSGFPGSSSCAARARARHSATGVRSRPRLRAIWRWLSPAARGGCASRILRKRNLLAGTRGPPLRNGKEEGWLGYPAPEEGVRLILRWPPRRWTDGRLAVEWVARLPSNRRPSCRGIRRRVAQLPPPAGGRGMPSGPS